ncbi:MAG: ABC transporter ATP-binding protein [bacterium]|nr:ABC transporter ATP-binding protein [bacterium]
MPQPAVLVEDLVVRYGDRKAVDGLSFSAAAGQVVALVGPNGAGKTTTVEACVGLRTPESGRIEILGQQSGSTLRSRVGVMLQDGGLYPTARPLELVRHVAGLYPRSEDPAGLLAALGIDPAIRTTIRRLSGGEQQRVKCALALVGRPDLVFLDEPTAGLDSAGRRTFHDLIRGLTARGATVVLTTHLMDDVETLADQIVVVAGGRDVHHGSVSDLVGDVDTIWLRLPAGVTVDPLRALLPQGVQVEQDRQGMHRIGGASDPSLLGVVATWCGRNAVPTSDLIVGRRSLDDVVRELIEDQA